MKLALFSAFLLCALFGDVTLASTNDNDVDTVCIKDYKNLETCYLDQIGTQVDEKAKEYKESILKCFAARKNCQAPDFDRDPMSELPRFMRKIAEKLKEEWANTSQAVKQCIRKNITEEVATVLNKCIGKRGVQQFNVTQFAEAFADEGGTDMFGEMVSDQDSKNNNTEKSWKTFLLGRLNMARAFRECDENQRRESGTNSTRINSNSESLGRCTRTVFVNAKAHFCNETVKCRRDAPQNCVKRAERVYGTVCECKYTKILEMVQRLDDLRFRGNVTMSEMMKAMSSGEDPRKYLSAINDCYVKYNQKTPSIIKFVDVLSKAVATNSTSDPGSSGSSGSGSKSNGTEKAERNQTSGNDSVKYTGEPDPMLTHAQPAVVDIDILTTIRDFLASQAMNQEECIPCVK